MVSGVYGGVWGWVCFLSRCGTMLSLMSEPLGMFAMPIPIIVYTFLVPMLDAFSEMNDLECYNNTAPKMLHAALFSGVLIVTAVHAVFAEVHWYQLRPSYFQRTANTAIAKCFFRGVPTRTGFALGVALQLAVVAFWSVFLGPEPLSCVMLVKPEDFAAFEVSRAMVFAMSGGCLFLLLFTVNYYGRPPNTRASSSSHVPIPPPDTERLMRADA